MKSINVSDIHARLKRLEEIAGSHIDDETVFHNYCSGEYDPTISLRENLRLAELPPGAVPAAPDLQNELPGQIHSDDRQVNP